TVFYNQSVIGDSVNSALFQAKLSADGTTWSDEIRLTDDSMNVRGGGTGGVRFSNGNVYFAMYKVEGDLSSSATMTSKVLVYKSTDDGVTFSPTAAVLEDATASLKTFEPGL